MRLLFCLCLFICQLVSFAQSSFSGYQIFENIKLDNETSVVTTFTQDRSGLMWVGTNKGLYSYDGYNAYPHYVYGQSSNSRVYCFATHSDSHLYIGTDNGLLCYDLQHLKYCPLRSSLPTDIRALYIQENRLWIGSLNGLYCDDLKSVNLTRFDSGMTSGLPHNTMYSLLPYYNTGQKNEKLDLGTYKGFCRFEPDTMIFEKIEPPSR